MKVGTAAHVFLLAPFLAACAQVPIVDPIVADIQEKPVTWEFIQATGGFDIGTPYLDDYLLWVPLELDLSGKRRITREPVLQDTGLKCLRAELDGRQQRSLIPVFGRNLPVYDLYLEVYSTGENLSGHFTCDEVPVPVGSPFSLTPPLMEATTFRLWYRDSLFQKHLIEEFVI